MSMRRVFVVIWILAGGFAAAIATAHDGETHPELPAGRLMAVAGITLLACAVMYLSARWRRRRDRPLKRRSCRSRADARR